MQMKRFSEEQIIPILKQAEPGLPLPELLRKYRISAGTHYRWKSKFGGLEESDAKRLNAGPRFRGAMQQLVLRTRGKRSYPRGLRQPVCSSPRTQRRTCWKGAVEYRVLHFGNS
jgi:putative transposase